MDKKAQGMSMNIIIIAALAVMVLLLVGSFMTGGFRALTGKITSFVAAGPSAETAAATTGCDTACTTWKSAGCPVAAVGAVKDATQTDTENRCGAIGAPDTTTSPGNTIYTAGTCKCTIATGGSSWGK